jgi:hypothetical protein
MKLDIAQVKDALARNTEWEIGSLQIAMYVAVGGGILGKMYAEHPLHAYTDARVGKLPYKARAIEQIRQVLVAMAEVRGLDPNNLPPMPQFHSCGIF